uniref:Uncharacterized protein n=1 Tax=Salix viminalis TaxID=40686 RepID=A0A6N2KFA0_SALVM
MISHLDHQEQNLIFQGIMGVKHEYIEEDSTKRSQFLCIATQSLLPQDPSEKAMWHGSGASFQFEYRVYMHMLSFRTHGNLHLEASETHLSFFKKMCYDM